MHSTAAADAVIFGGGIAGLWILNRLRQQGLSVLLFETGNLGGGQTFQSQGIIHGGMKYALQGILTGEANALTDIPALWRACLQGNGEINLSSVNILSHRHYLWSPNKFTAKIAGFLASTAFHSGVEKTNLSEIPEVFRHSEFKGEVYGVDEIVLDVPSLVKELEKKHQDCIFKINPFTANDFSFNEDRTLASVQLQNGSHCISVRAQQFIFAAGAGNGLIAQQLNLPSIAMQKRPLRMVLVKTPFRYPLYAHCVGFGSKPRITITTHYTSRGETIWYLGGQIAEEGVNRNEEEQIEFAKKELSELFPWLDFQKAQFASFRVDRAEPAQANHHKPDTAFSKTIGNVTICWPTKLALSPKLAEEVLKQFNAQNIKPLIHDTQTLQTWSKPSLASPIWEELFCSH